MKYSDIEDAFVFLSMVSPHERYAYLNRETGETYYVSKSDDLDESPDDLEGNDKYISIPHINDLNIGKNLVFDFISAKLPKESERVRKIFRGKGAYARFKTMLGSKGLLSGWYKFEKQATEEALRRWCIENNIILEG